MIDPTAAAEHKAVDERATRRTQHELQLAELQRGVDAATNALATAEGRHDQFSQRIKELTATAESLWTQTTGAVGISPVAGLVEAYTNINALETACLHFPDVKRRLAVNVDVATERLAEFSKRNPR